jgi:drug/metabolite transporter (DMT)-like permease
MIVASGVAFGSLSVLAKLAYSAGLGVEQTLAVRFTVAAAGMWVVALLFRQSPFGLPAREVARLVALGLVFYAGQSLTYFIALQTLPASLCVLIAYVYPSLVVLAGWLFLHRAVSRPHIAGLAASFVGVALLVGGADVRLGWALVLAIASPMIYTGYILFSERAMTSVPAVGGSALIMSGAAVSFCVMAAARGELRPPSTPAAWGYALAIAVIPTMLAISFFLGGLLRVGAARSALLSTVEPVVTLALAAILLGEGFSRVQIAGAVLVLAAVVLVQSAHMRRPAPPPASLK